MTWPATTPWRPPPARWPLRSSRPRLGWTLLKLGRNREAREAFEAVLAFAPDQLSAREGLGQVP